MKINREARIAIMRGLSERKVTPRRAWAVFAEKQGLGKPSGVIDRVKRDYGELAVREMLEILDESIPEREALPPIPPHRESVIRHVLETKPEVFFPEALPDELFAWLAGCFASGDTLDELFDSLQEGVALYLADEGEKGGPLHVATATLTDRPLTPA